MICSQIAVISPATISLSVTTTPTKSELPRRDAAIANSPGATQVDSVPILDLQRQYEQVRAEVLAAV